jgi:hypothetical protein
MRRQKEGLVASALPPARYLGAAVALLLAVVVWLLAPWTLAGTAHLYERSFGPDGTGATQFGRPGPIGVDQQSHDFYVGDLASQTLYKFDQNSLPATPPSDFSALGSNEITGLAFGGFEAENQVAVDPVSHRIYLTQNETDSIKAFEPNGEEAEFSALGGSSEITGLEEFCGVAVDADGNIYTGNYIDGVHVYAPSGAEITSFADPEACNLAVDSEGNVYAAVFLGPVSKFVPSESPVTATTTYSNDGVVDSTSSLGLAVDPVSDEPYVARQLNSNHSQIVQYAKDGSIVTSFGGPSEPGELTIAEGIGVDGGNGNVFVSDAESGALGGGSRQVEIFAPPPPAPPEVGAVSARDVTSSSANLQAQINPKSFDTHYRFQYLTQSQFEANGGGFANALETPDADLGSAGEIQTAHVHIAGLSPGVTYRFRVIATSNCNPAQPAEICTATNAEPPAAHFKTFPLSTQGLPDGRAYEMVSPPQKAGEVFPLEPLERLGGSCATRNCSPGAGGAMMPMQSDPTGESVAYSGQPFSPGLASTADEYLGRRSASGWSTQGLSSANFNAEEAQGYKGFSTDLSRSVIYQVEPALSADAPAREGTSFANLYLRREGEPLQALVSVEPPQRSPGRKGSNPFAIVYAGANAGTSTAPAFSHLVFEANDSLTPADPKAPVAPPVAATEKNLYEWVSDQLRLVNVLPGNSAAASGAVIGSGKLLAAFPTLEGPDVDHAVSDDGSHIFWSDAGGQVYVRIDGEETEKIEDPGKFLTASSDGLKVLLSDGCLYDLKTKACTDVAQGHGAFEGILGASEDLSRIYFVNTSLELYAWNQGTSSLIATLLAADNATGQAPLGDWKPSPSNRTAQVSPDGRYLAFMSRAPLTGYDNLQADDEASCLRGSGTSACFEVFAYDADLASLTCASCSPTDQRPLGGSSLSLIGNLPGFAPFPQPSNLTDGGGGRLFFESLDALSPRDTNGGVQDVYQWEPNGIGSCGQIAGCVSLISSGHGGNDSWFLDASSSGNDAFIVTRSQLLPQDKDERLDLYDARVGGGIEEAVTAHCSGEGCKGPISPSVAEVGPGSSSFTGPGNQTPPKHKKHKKHKKKKHRKQHHGKRSAQHNRGGFV